MNEIITTIQITKIEPQKKNKNRFSLFVDDQFICGVSQGLLLSHDLYPGKKISETELKKLKEAERSHQIYDQALGYLSRRAHSQKELQQKLQNKGFANEEIAPVIKKLIQKKYLDDTNFTRLFIDEEIRLKHTGPLILKSKLIKRGISLALIEKEMANLYPDEQQVENCLYLMQKKQKNQHANLTEKQKLSLMNYLKGKGFSWYHIENAFAKLKGD